MPIAASVMAMPKAMAMTPMTPAHSTPSASDTKIKIPATTRTICQLVMFFLLQDQVVERGHQALPRAGGKQQNTERE